MVAAAVQLDDQLGLGGDLRRAVGIRHTDERVGVGDVELAIEQGHAGRRVQPGHEDMAFLGNAIAVRIAQQRDAIGRGHARARLVEQAAHDPGFDPAAFAGRRIGFGDQHVAVGQAIQPARMIEAARERLHRQARGGGGRFVALPADDIGDLDGGQRLVARFGDGGALAGDLIDRQLRRIRPGEIDDDRHGDDGDERGDAQDVLQHGTTIRGVGLAGKGAAARCLSKGVFLHARRSPAATVLRQAQHERGEDVPKSQTPTKKDRRCERGSHRRSVIPAGRVAPSWWPGRTVCLRPANRPAGRSVIGEHRGRIGAGIDFGDRAQLRIGAEHQVGARGGPLLFVRVAIGADELLVAVIADLLPRGAHVEQVHEEVVGQLTRPVGEDAVLARLGMVGAEDAEARNQNRHLGRRQAEQLRPIDHQLLGRHIILDLQIVAEGVGLRLQHVEAFRVGLFGAGVGAAGREGHRDRVARGLGRRLDPHRTAEHDQVGDRHLLVALAVEVALDALIDAEHLGELFGVVDLPVLLGRQADAATIGAAAMIRPAPRRCRRPGGCDQLGNRQAGIGDRGLEVGDVAVVDLRIVRDRDRILPDQLFLRHFRADQTDLRAHVAVRQLVPGARPHVGEIGRVRTEFLADRIVGRVDLQRHIGGGHHRRHALARGVRGRRQRLVRIADGVPLVRTGGAFGQLVLMVEEHVEIAHVPRRRCRRPRAFDATGDRVIAHAAFVRRRPAEALRCDVGAFRLDADELRIARAMRLAERVAAGGERDGLFVVHAHAGERFTHMRPIWIAASGFSSARPSCSSMRVWPSHSSSVPQ
ncbi:hypothetical protein WR25_24971 [Diploscapter pachys]|uniref:Uncharacterized protein n=1 Tax=Diploscapter pachys TaxID=2018661 RepID=A0A2A2M2C0_9BILA|nr:hypothetical protein WR25_24971 [Diploscapter pachys]